MASELQEAMDLLVEDLEDTKEIIGSNPGPLDEPEKSQTKGKLDSIEQHIENALAQINNLGVADPLNHPSTLEEIAAECHKLAVRAHDEADKPVPNSISIGSNLKTIDRLMRVDEGYREKAGTS